MRPTAAHLAAGLFAICACGPTSDSSSEGGAPNTDGADAGGTNSDDIQRPDAGPGCASLEATVRDFRTSHPDFERFTGDEVFTGIVERDLGADGKPVYAHPGATAHTTGPAEFDEWYRNVPGINQPLSARIDLIPVGNGVYVFDDPLFFPIDGRGFGDGAAGEDGLPHNFHFTTEVNTIFEYEQGQTFSFTGDDDLWLFVNGRLALDLGGLHQPATGTVDLDAQAADLGIVPGQSYAMDIFHAERHTIGSTFHIETTIDCFIVN